VCQPVESREGRGGRPASRSTSAWYSLFSRRIWRLLSGLFLLAGARGRAICFYSSLSDATIYRKHQGSGEPFTPLSRSAFLLQVHSSDGRGCLNAPRLRTTLEEVSVGCLPGCAAAPCVFHEVPSNSTTQVQPTSSLDTILTQSFPCPTHASSISVHSSTPTTCIKSDPNVSAGLPCDPQFPSFRVIFHNSG
jgi:hypothetical protein